MKQLGVRIASGTQWLSKAIQGWTGTTMRIQTPHGERKVEVNHVRVVLGPDGLHPYWTVSQAGIRLEWIREDQIKLGPKDFEIRHIFNVPGDRYDAVMKEIQVHNGESYDARDYLNFIPGLRRFAHSSPDDAMWICSEWAARLLRMAGVPFVHPEISDEQLSPRDLALSIQRLTSVETSYWYDNQWNTGK